MSRAIGGTLRHFLKTIETIQAAEEIARQRGLLQKLDPRAKIAGVFAWILVAAWARNLRVLALIIAGTIVLALLSRVPMGFLAGRVWLTAASIAGVLALPALFFTPGSSMGYGVTEQGARSVAFLVTRAVTIASLSALLVLTTPWARILKGLRVLGVPAIAVVILSMTYRYIFVLIQTAREMLEGRDSRTLGKLSLNESRRLATSAMGVLMGKSLQMSEEVYQAMRSRGYHGEVYLLDEMRLTGLDWFAAVAFTAAAMGAGWIN